MAFIQNLGTAYDWYYTDFQLLRSSVKWLLKKKYCKPLKMLMWLPSVKIAGAFKVTFGTQHCKFPLTTNFTETQHCKTTSIPRNLFAECPSTSPTHCVPRRGKREQFVTTAYGRVHHVLLSKSQSKAIPTPEKPEQHGCAACVLLMASHASCPRKPNLTKDKTCNNYKQSLSPKCFGGNRKPSQAGVRLATEDTRRNLQRQKHIPNRGRKGT